MAKSAFQRSYTENLQKRWGRLLKATDPNRDHNCLTFGKVFSRDPYDCGHPRCPLCSYGKVLHPKEKRFGNRKAEKQAFLELVEEEHETETLEP